MKCHDVIRRTVRTFRDAERTVTEGAVRKLIRCASITQLGSFVSDVRNFERTGEC